MKTMVAILMPLLLAGCLCNESGFRGFVKQVRDYSSIMVQVPGEDTIVVQLVDVPMTPAWNLQYLIPPGAVVDVRRAPGFKDACDNNGSYMGVVWYRGQDLNAVLRGQAPWNPYAYQSDLIQNF